MRDSSTKQFNISHHHNMKGLSPKPSRSLDTVQYSFSSFHLVFNGGQAQEAPGGTNHCILLTSLQAVVLYLQAKKRQAKEIQHSSNYPHDAKRSK
jgi:hypothetical protein